MLKVVHIISQGNQVFQNGKNMKFQTFPTFALYVTKRLVKQFFKLNVIGKISTICEINFENFENSSDVMPFIDLRYFGKQ